MNLHLQIAIDGTAASGKSTVAKRLAERLHIAYLDTGKLYRAVALAFLKQTNAPPQAWTNELAQEVLTQTLLEVRPSTDYECRVYLQGDDVTDQLNEPSVENAVPRAACLPYVREWLLDQQQDLGRRAPIVMAGRDIGTIVLPNADVKVFMQADLGERARRRLVQQGQSLDPANMQQAQDSLAARDEADRNRACAPMVIADDALCLDSTHLDPEALVQLIVDRLKSSSQSS